MNKMDQEALVNFIDTGSLNDYQEVATGFAIYPGQGTPLGLGYVALKMNGEAGELAEHIGKSWRDDNIIVTHEADIFNPDAKTKFSFREMSPERRELIIKEMGDVLWYVAACAREMGIPLEEVACKNIQKLADRQQRGVQGGSGDNR